MKLLRLIALAMFALASPASADCPVEGRSCLQDKATYFTRLGTAMLQYSVKREIAIHQESQGDLEQAMAEFGWSLLEFRELLETNDIPWGDMFSVPVADFLSRPDRLVVDVHYARDSQTLPGPLCANGWNRYIFYPDKNKGEGEILQLCYSDGGFRVFGKFPYMIE